MEASVTKPDLKTNQWKTLLLVALLGVAGGALATAAQAEPALGRPVPAASPYAAAQTQAEPGPIILYTTSWCGYCRKTRALLTELGEAFEDKDIEKSAAAQREYQAKGQGYSGIPLIDFDGTILRGYNEAKLRALVAERKKRASSQAHAVNVAEVDSPRL
jgi:glutaredoxin